MYLYVWKTKQNKNSSPHQSWPLPDETYLGKKKKQQQLLVLLDSTADRQSGQASNWIRLVHIVRPGRLFALVIRSAFGNEFILITRNRADSEFRIFFGSGQFWFSVGGILVGGDQNKAGQSLKAGIRDLLTWLDWLSPSLHSTPLWLIMWKYLTGRNYQIGQLFF